MRSNGLRHLLLEPVDGRDTGLELAGRGVDAHALGQGAPDLLSLLRIEWRTNRFLPGTCQPGHDPAADHLALKIGKDA